MTTVFTKPWERQPDEPEKAYLGFRKFLHLQPPRTYAEAARVMDLGYDHIAAWGRKYNWQHRASQYDAWNDGRIDEARLSAIKVFQSQIVTEEVTDYQRLRQVWQASMADLEANAANIDMGEFLDRMKKLTAIRTLIDQMARKAASLPNTYRAAELPAETKSDNNAPIMLTMDGPRILEEKNGTDD